LHAPAGEPAAVPATQAPPAEPAPPRGNLARVAADETNLISDYTTEPVTGTGIKLCRGNLAYFLEEKDSWYRVKLRNGMEGWIASWDALPGNGPGQLPPANLPADAAVSSSKPIYAKVFSDVAIVRSEPSNDLPAVADHSRLGVFEKDTILKVVGSKPHWAKVELGKDVFIWIQDEQLDMSATPAPAPVLVKSALRQRNDKGETVRITLDRRAPRLAFSHERSVTLKLYGLETKTARKKLTATGLNPEITAAGVTAVTLATSGFPFGYDINYEDNTLVFTIRNQKQVNKSKPLQGYVIAVDPGHGAATAGVPGYREGARAHGIREEELNLDVALRLQKLIGKQGGRVVMTRTGPDDSMRNIYNRSKKARDEGADIFLDIHANTGEPQAYGPEIYYYDEQSKPLAEAVASSFGKMRRIPVPALFASFGVIRMTQMPAVTVEMGYLTNKDEAKLFKRDKFRDQCAQAMLDGLIQYLAISGT
jgi:N-acetylmuramoyl-L-alanine amidase